MRKKIKNIRKDKNFFRRTANSVAQANLPSTRMAYRGGIRL